jgi:hypothetical protein
MCKIGTALDPQEREHGPDLPPPGSPVPREVGATSSSAKKSRLHSKPEERSPDPRPT